MIHAPALPIDRFLPTAFCAHLSGALNSNAVNLAGHSFSLFHCGRPFFF